MTSNRRARRFLTATLGRWWVLLLLAAIIFGRTWYLGTHNTRKATGCLTAAIESMTTPPPARAYTRVPAGYMSDFIILSIGPAGDVREEPFVYKSFDPNSPRDTYFVTADFTHGDYGIWTRVADRDEPKMLATLCVSRNGSVVPDRTYRVPAAEIARLRDWLAANPTQVPAIGKVAQAMQSPFSGYDIYSRALLHDAAMLLATAALLSGVWFVPARIRSRRRRAGRCPACDYDLTGLLEPLCPECGHTTA